MTLEGFWTRHGHARHRRLVFATHLDGELERMLRCLVAVVGDKQILDGHVAFLLLDEVLSLLPICGLSPVRGSDRQCSLAERGRTQLYWYAIYQIMHPRHE